MAGRGTGGRYPYPPTHGKHLPFPLRSGPSPVPSPSMSPGQGPPSFWPSPGPPVFSQQRAEDDEMWQQRRQEKNQEVSLAIEPARQRHEEEEKKMDAEKKKIAAEKLRHDAERMKEGQRMVEKYKDLASKLVGWLNITTDWIVQSGVPAAFMEIKAWLAEISRFQTKDVPPQAETRKEILRIYDNLQYYGVSLLRIEESLGPDKINHLWTQFESTLIDRQMTMEREINKLEKLQALFERVHQETENLEVTLHNIEHHIKDMKKDQNTLKEKQNFDALAGELKNIEDRIISLGTDVQALQQGEYLYMDEVNKFLRLQSRADQIKTSFFSVSSQISPSKVSVKNAMIIAQYQESFNKDMVETNHAFQHVQGCLQWLQTKESTLEDEWYGRDINSIKQALSEHTQNHQDIISFNTEVDQCIKDRETQSKKEQEQYNQWLYKVQEAYRALLDSSLQRLQRLQLLLDFVQAAEQELNWLKEKIEQICNCSPDLLNMPCEQIYQDVVMGMRSQEAHFNLVQEHGTFLASQIHPAKVTIETFILDMKSHWVWLQLFLECLNMHSVQMSDYMKFFGEAQRCETWMSQKIETIDKWTRLQNLPLEELQKMKKECHDLQIDLVRYDKDVASLCKSSCCIIPFKERLPHVTFQNKILCLCNYEQPTMTLRNGEECTLLDNSQSVRWKVRNSRRQEDTVPSICLQILPPNLEAVDLAERLKIQLDELKTLLRNLIQNIVLSQIQFIKALDVKQLKLQDQANHEALLRNVNYETGKLIKEVGEADQEMKHLQKELDECNQGFHNLIRELQEEEKGRKNKTLDEDLIEKLETCSHQLNNLYQYLKHREQLPTSVDKNTVVKACQEQSEWEKTVQQQECCIEELKQAVQKLLTRHHQIESLLKNIIQMWDEMTRLGKTYADRLRSLADAVQDPSHNSNSPSEKQLFEANTPNRINLQHPISSGLYRDKNSTMVQKVKENTWKTTAPSEGFAWQWEKFEMRFEIKKAHYRMSSTNYPISDVSPVKIQYISNIESENNSLLHKLSTRNLKGVFESDLLRILLEEEEYIRTRTEDQIHFSYLKKEVIAILKCHIQENPSIEEEHLASVTLDNVRKAHELQNLECVISGRVNIYISRSGEGVTIVGREIGKYIESINSALEQRSKNEPDSRTHCRTEGAVSSVSEPKRSKGKHDTGSEAFTDESLEHFEETEEETKKSGEVSEFERHVILTELTVQMLKASNFQGESSKDISAVSVVLNRNEVVFQGTPEVVQKAEAHLVQYLKSKGYWHEINETASFIEATKRLNFEDHLKRKFPDVHIIFTDMKITFFGEKSLASEDELSHFRRSIEKCVIQYDDNFIVNYLKLLDVQKYIWEQFEKKHILCFWQVTETGIELSSRNDQQFAAAKTIFEECIAVTDLDPSRTEVQEIEKSPNWRKLCYINKGMLLREVLHAGCVIYVGMPEVIKQIKELYCRLVEQGNLPQIHSLQVLLSQPVLSYVRKYLVENIKQQFEVNCILLADKSGIMITGSKESVQGAVCEVQNQSQQLSIDVCPLRNPEVTQTPTSQVKISLDAMEEENKTIIEIISLPRKGKDTMTVPISAALDVSLLYGSTSGRDIGMQLIPVNDRLFPCCLAAIDIMEKGVNLVRKAATCFEQYVKNKDEQKPVDFMFIPDDFNSNQCIVYFVMPDNPSDIKDFKQKFKQGLLPVLDYACQRKITSMSLPLEMHEQLPVRQMFTIIMDILKIYMEKAESQKRKSEVFLCSVDRTNYSIVRKLLDKETHDEEDTMESFLLEEDFYDSNDESESEVDITIITGNLTEQKVDIIVNSTSQSLNLNQGYVSKSILDAAGSTIQDECNEKYPHGIQFGEIAVTSAGNLGCKKIFHGALHKKNEKYLQTIRWLMKNCLQTAGKEKLQSIAFPALGIGKLEYPVEVVAKEMFQAVTQSAQRHGVKTVKFVLQEGEKKTYQTFQQMAKIREHALQDAQNPDFNPKFEVHLEGCRLKVHIVATEKKSSVCDVDVFLSSPPAGTLIETVLLDPDGFFGSKKILKINRDPGQWGEKLYLCWDRALDLKQELVHAVDYMKLMKFTSFAVYLVQDLTLQESQNVIEAVIFTLDTKKPFDDLEKVTVIVSNDMFQQMTQWLKEKVHESMNRTATFWKKINIFSSEVKTEWTDLQSPSSKTKGTYIRVTGSNRTSVQTSIKKIMETALLQIPQKQEGRKTYSQSPSSTTVPESFMNIVYANFKTEVAKNVLKAIQHSCGENGIQKLVMELRGKAQVEEINGKICICCDFKHAKDVQQCVFRNYKKAKNEDKTAYNTPNKHLIDGGNTEMKELLQFAYGETDWNKKLRVEEGKLYLFATLNVKKEVEAAVQTVSLWCHEDFFLSSDEQQKAAEAMKSVQKEFPAIFIKQISNTVTMKGDNAEKKFERAKHKMKVALGRIKITLRERSGRNLKAGGGSFSSLPLDDRMKVSPLSLPSDLQTSKIYNTEEGITVKVYQGDIIRLPVDCIVNAANKVLSHGGGVALAIARAAGREFDREGENYVRKHGPVPVTQCCVTSAGQLSYAAVIHVVGPQWHDYKHDEKDSCGDDLKKTIVNCLIEANRLNMSSIAIPSISSGIFGVPKLLCAKMYALGVLEFSKTCGLQSIKEVHFVDMLSEMCQLTQQAFETELKNSSRHSPETSRDTSHSHMNKPPPAILRHSQVSENYKVKTQNEAKFAKTQRSYAEVLTTEDQMQLEGNKQNPYVFKPLENIIISIYNHDITDISVEAIVCPVSPFTEGGVVKFVKHICGSDYADATYRSTCRNVGDAIVTTHNKQNLHFKYIIHVYSPHWFSPEDEKYGKEFEKSMENIFQQTRRYALRSLAIPIPGIGDEEKPVPGVCEYMMDGILDFCSRPDIKPLTHTTIHLVTNDFTRAFQLKEIACQKLKQNHEVTGKGHQSWERSVEHSEFGTSGLNITIRNDKPKSIIPEEPPCTSQHGSMRGHEGQMDTCPICMDTPEDPVALNKCGHILCRQCMERTLKNKPVCPMCGTVYGIITGTQPPGTMDVNTTSSKLPGFKYSGTIEIFYNFPDGIQSEEHPNPGQPYQGTRRRAYLPDNIEGRKVQSLLRKAFDRRLVFTIGRSVTTGVENTVTWNDIHHKTNKDGGPQNFGYPDDDYLRRVQEELAAKGITKDT